LEEALDLSSDRILNEWMNEKCISFCIRFRKIQGVSVVHVNERNEMN